MNSGSKRVESRAILIGISKIITVIFQRLNHETDFLILIKIKLIFF